MRKYDWLVGVLVGCLCALMELSLLVLVNKALKISVEETKYFNYAIASASVLCVLFIIFCLYKLITFKK